MQYEQLSLHDKMTARLTYSWMIGDYAREIIYRTLIDSRDLLDLVSQGILALNPTAEQMLSCLRHYIEH